MPAISLQNIKTEKNNKLPKAKTTSLWRYKFLSNIWTKSIENYDSRLQAVAGVSSVKCEKAQLVATKKMSRQKQNFKKDLSIQKVSIVKLLHSADYSIYFKNCAGEVFAIFQTFLMCVIFWRKFARSLFVVRRFMEHVHKNCGKFTSLIKIESVGNRTSNLTRQ